MGTENPNQLGAHQGKILIEAVEKVRTGSPSQVNDGMTTILNHYGPRVERRARSWLHKDELVHEACSIFQQRAWERLRQFRGTEVRSLTSWVNKTAYHIVIDVWRQHAHDPESFTDVIEKRLAARQKRHARFLGQQRGPNGAKVAKLGNKVRIRLIIAALHRFPELEKGLEALTYRQRQVIRRRADGLTNPAIAAELHIPAQTVAGHVSLGCKRLVKYAQEMEIWDGGLGGGISPD